MSLSMKVEDVQKHVEGMIEIPEFLAPHFKVEVESASEQVLDSLGDDKLKQHYAGGVVVTASLAEHSAQCLFGVAEGDEVRAARLSGLMFDIFSEIAMSCVKESF